MALNEKYEHFAREYVVDYNATQAAVRAGYSQKTAKQQGSRLLTNADILARVRELQAEVVQRLAISEDRVIEALWETYNRCMQAVPVMEYSKDLGEYVETGEYTFDSKGALRALELIGKHLGMFTDKVEVKGRLDTGQQKLDDILHQLRGNSSG